MLLGADNSREQQQLQLQQSCEFVFEKRPPLCVSWLCSLFTVVVVTVADRSRQCRCMLLLQPVCLISVSRLFHDSKCSLYYWYLPFSSLLLLL